jgi:hypothetical protein
MKWWGREQRGRAPSVYTKSRAVASMCAGTVAFSAAEPAKPLALHSQPAGAKAQLYFLFSIRELKFTLRREIVDPGTPVASPGSFRACDEKAEMRKGGGRLCDSGGTSQETHRHAETSRTRDAQAQISPGTSFGGTAPSSRRPRRRPTAAAGGDD